jgi:hypothetical protein
MPAITGRARDGCKMEQIIAGKIIQKRILFTYFSAQI